jgi:DtxR family transcriptional regulator, Mn-dependent transcriptional regulator
MGPLNTRLPEEVAEVLEATWALEEKGESRLEDILGRVSQTRTAADRQIIDAMLRENLIAVDETNRVTLLPEGKTQAGQIIRRHRLAERLVCDVLGLKVEDSEGPACEFEHLIEEGITNSICTLLGHPRFCPHNRPIPEGECCRQAREELRPIVVSCDQLDVGESAKIAYVCVREHVLVEKLSSLGIMPGGPIRLLQKWPAYVLLCDETEVAVEEDVARRIYVWQSQ